MNFIHTFLRWCPGALGLFLRQKMYPKLFKSCGRGVIFGRFLFFNHPEKIAIGNHVVLNNRVHLAVIKESTSQQTLVLDDNVFIGESTVLQCNTGKMIIQSGSNISSYCFLIAHSPLTIGKKVLIASYCLIGSKADNKKNRISQKSETLATHIGNGCWLGTRTRVEPGVTIGDETIIGAHSRVCQDLPEWAICFGQPAIKYRDRISQNHNGQDTEVPQTS
jgi:acetyltransferase-like isoleucine patch superfamily enzyme